jgi:hypothetical protein
MTRQSDFGVLSILCFGERAAFDPDRGAQDSGVAGESAVRELVADHGTLGMDRNGREQSADLRSGV